MDGDAKHIKSILAQGKDDNAIFHEVPQATQVLKDDLVVLLEIEQALDRLDGGSFGYCTSCGVQLDILRLAHDPTISCCLSCQRAGKRPTEN